MILVKYSKLDGAEFIPHLDTLRHLTKIIRRMGIQINYSQGFNPHILIYMSSPIALGLKSKSEYLLIDTNEKVENFKEKFNNCSLKGIKCVESFYTEKKIKVASDIESAIYSFKGFTPFSCNEILDMDTFIVIDKNGKEREVRDKILNLEFIGDTLYAKLKFGNDTLRPDYLANKLVETYGGEHINIVKESVRFLNDLTDIEYLEKQ